MTAPETMSLATLQGLIAKSRSESEEIEFKKTTGELGAPVGPRLLGGAGDTT